MGRSKIDGTAVLTRQLAYTTLPCTMAPEVLADMGLVPPSPEGEEAEHVAGHARKDTLVPIAPYLAPLIGITAELLSRAILEDTSEREYSEEEREALTAHYQTIIRQSSIGIISQLIHMQMLAVTVGGTGEFLG